MSPEKKNLMSVEMSFLKSTFFIGKKKSLSIIKEKMI